ncbi:two-component system, HptB-dependent secretion and biofilm response regulator [Candidatus Magnetomoraceae bacterium gMMP-15]
MTVTDLNEKKQDKKMIKELSYHNEELEHLLEKRTQELQAVNQKLNNEINRRKKAEQNSLEMVSQLLLTMESTQLGYLLIKNNIAFLCNPAVKEITGYEFTNKKFWNCVHPDFHYKIKSYVNMEVEKLPGRCDIKIITANGEERWLDLFINASDFNSDLIGVITIIDITYRKKTEEFLLQALDVKTEQVKQRSSELEMVDNLYQKSRQEYEFASKVFDNLMQNPDLKCQNVNILLSSMETVCGDLALVAPKPSGGLYAFLGDFTGHGLAAAIGAIPVTDIFYKMTNKNALVVDIIAEINKKLKKSLPTGFFLAACFITLDYEKGLVSIWSGGIPDVFITSEKGGIKQCIEAQHLPLGVVSNDQLDLSLKIVEVDEDDRIYVYSDGVTEAMGPNKEMFGEKRLEKHFNSKNNIDNMLGKIMSSLKTFKGNVLQKDDITMMEILCNRKFECRFINKEQYQKVNSTGWHLSLKFDAKTIQKMELTSCLMSMIEKDVRLKDYKEDIYIILQELITNAIDYGLLRMDSSIKKSIEGFAEYAEKRVAALSSLSIGWIKADINYDYLNKKESLIVKIEDSGSGFNYQKDSFDLSSNLSFSGRGLPLIKSLCRELTFHGNGSQVQVVYDL